MKQQRFPFGDEGSLEMKSSPTFSKTQYVYGIFAAEINLSM